MNVHGAQPRRSARGASFSKHTFQAHTRSCAEMVWAALTDADTTASFMYGLSACSTWQVDDPISFGRGEQIHLSGRVLFAQPGERLSYVLQSGPEDPPVYLTWSIRPAAGGCAIGLEVDQVDDADSGEEAADVWLPVLAALQNALNRT